MSDSTSDTRLAIAIADRIPGCGYRDLVRLAKFMGTKRANQQKRWLLEMEVERIIFNREQMELF